MVFKRSAAPLVGTKVTLRPWAPEEAEWYVSSRDDEVFRFTTEHRGLSVEIARQRLEECLADPSMIGYAIVETATRELAGNIALSPTDLDDREGEVMYWLAADARGRGLASDAVRTLVGWAFAVLPIERVQLLTDSDNEPSQHVAIACSFEPAGEVDGRLCFVLARR